MGISASHYVIFNNLESKIDIKINQLHLISNNVWYTYPVTPSFFHYKAKTKLYTLMNLWLQPIYLIYSFNTSKV